VQSVQPPPFSQLAKMELAKLELIIISEFFFEHQLPRMATNYQK